jgi:hypothetical protein
MLEMLIGELSKLVGGFFAEGRKGFGGHPWRARIVTIGKLQSDNGNL